VKTAIQGVLLPATQSSGLIFENVTVTNSGKDGIAFDRVSSSTIYKSNLSQNKGNGATLTSTSKVNFQNSTSTQNTNIGIFLNGTSTENVIFQSVIFGNGKAGISSSLSKGVGESKNSILENLISKNGDDGITLLLTNKLNIVSNTIKENKDHGVSIASSTAIVMSKNSILDNMNEAIVVGKGAEQIDILDNTILDSGFLLPLEKQGKSLGVNIGNGSTHILLSGNTIKNSTDVKYQNYGIKIGSLASYVFAKSNNVTDMGTSGVLVEGDWGTKCVYDDSVPMPRYQKLKCYFLSFFN
jgi:parallel beta-helix repeat protein